MKEKKRKYISNFNHEMHPRNKYYNNPPNYKKMAEIDPEFKKYLYKKNHLSNTYTINWKDPVSVKELTKQLLKQDFQLNWDIPLDRLCPPIPNRLNYIHWIEDLLTLHDPSLQSLYPLPLLNSSNSNNFDNKYRKENNKKINGIDIGTGASCIYPLLAHRLNNWSFLATDIDLYSLEYATNNIKINSLQEYIKLKHIKDKNTILLIKENDNDNDNDTTNDTTNDNTNKLIYNKTKYDFTMCNPPFFSSIKEIDSNPSNCCKGSSLEMITEGGELQFIKKMIMDSLIIKDKVTWYTCLIGKKKDVGKIISFLRENNILNKNIRTKQFSQGKTVRWGIAWTFSNMSI